MRRLLCFLLLFVFCAVATAHAEEVTSVVQMEYTVVMPDVTRVGLYTGAVKDGVPHGYGVFTTVNDQGEKWHYLGEWENGKMCGEGGQYWDYGRTQVGQYQNNDFSSIDVTESPLYHYHIDAKTSEFVRKWDGNFAENDAEYFAETSYFDLTRNAEEIAGSLVKVTGRCCSASNGKLTWCYISCDNGNTKIVYVDFPDNADIPYSLFAGDNITVYGQYIGYSLLQKNDSSYVLYPHIMAYAVEFVE